MDENPKSFTIYYTSVFWTVAQEQGVANYGYHQTHVTGTRHSLHHLSESAFINVLYVCVHAIAITNTDSEEYKKKYRATTKQKHTHLSEGLLMKC